jgi:hypothetical protein
MATGRNRKTWTLVLRCYACAGKFTQRHLTFDKVSALPLILPCPYCTARPYVGQRTRPGERFQIHGIVDLEDETETYYRKKINGETWYFNAECSNWPSEDFIELDGEPVVGEVCNECHGLVNAPKNDA